MLLVDADEADPRQRSEDRRARADHDRRLARGDPLALVAALGLGQRRVENRDPVAEARAKAADGLRRERDLRNEDDHAEPALERVACGLEVDLGLPAPGRPVEQEVAAVALERLAQPRERALLRRGQVLGLGFARQRIALGGLWQLLPPLSLRPARRARAPRPGVEP